MLAFSSSSYSDSESSCCSAALSILVKLALWILNLLTNLSDAVESLLEMAIKWAEYTNNSSFISRQKDEQAKPRCSIYACYWISLMDSLKKRGSSNWVFMTRSPFSLAPLKYSKYLLENSMMIWKWNEMKVIVTAAPSSTWPGRPRITNLHFDISLSLFFLPLFVFDSFLYLYQPRPRHKHFQQNLNQKSLILLFSNKLPLLIPIF